MSRYLVPLLLILSLAACQSASAPGSHVASLDQEIQLAPAERAVYESQGLTVEFVRITDDSRCPTDAQCVWAGEVKVQVATRIGTAEPVQHEIKAGDYATVGAFRVVVVNVQPIPVSTRQISPEEYRVTMKMEQ